MESVASNQNLSFQSIFIELNENRWNIARTTCKERIAKLKKIKLAVEVTYRKALQEAMFADYGKNPAEADLAEIFPVISEIKHAIRHLSYWMQDEVVDTPLALFGSKSYIKYEPKGVCLIISPWNFPLNLTFCPLISAVAAGNVVVLKPSEMTPNTSAVMKSIIESTFPPNEVKLIEGDVAVSTALLELPFHHIFFTGAPSIGKVVMKAASNHLASVTLELGGKSPTIIDKTANIKDAAQMIVWGKFANCGQICIAPDYIYVHESIKAEFEKELVKNINNFYTNDASKSGDYMRIVNEKHTARIQGYLKETIENGANVLYGGHSNSDNNYIEPTLLSNVSLDSSVMKNEIFGPILPILSYQKEEEVIDYINNNEKPLALYIFSKSNKTINNILDNTSAGGCCINNVAVHFYNNNLPFGGINNSGLGKSHGIFGFKSFSNEKAVYKQQLPSALKLMMPPYTPFKAKLIRWVIKYL